MSVERAIQSRVVRNLAVACCLIPVLAETSFACTCFCLQGDDILVLGRNYDWHLDHGLVIVNKRGIAKRALLMDPDETPAEWVSKYGSVTFNQYGREIPCGGMNEAGLVLETMMLPETKYPGRDARPAVMAWLQYQLDTCATVDQVRAGDGNVRVSTISPFPLHFLGCDREGNMAIFEFLDGKLLCHTGEAMPVKALANHTYEKSLAYLKQHEGFGGTKAIPYGYWTSLDRFVCAADRVRSYAPSAGAAIIAYAFDTLTSVQADDATKWMIVYDPKKGEIHYRTYVCDRTRTIRLAACDFDARTPVQVISVNTAHVGLLNPYFHHYDTDVNRWLVYYSMKHTSELTFIPDAYLEVLIQYPEAPRMRFLTDWEIAGPYEQEGRKCQELFDVAFDPERSDTAVSWRDIRLKPFSDFPGYVDIGNALHGGPEKAAYLRTRISAGKEAAALLDIWSDDGVKAWLNGELIRANNVVRGISSQPDVAKIGLKRGSNTLMLKVTQSGGPWGAVVRLRPLDSTSPNSPEN